jgi:carboxyl-terminal processing protease
MFAAATALPSLPTVRIAHRLPAVLVLAVLLSGCATGPDAGLSKRMDAMFATLYTEVAETHVDPVDLEAFTLAGLKGLDRLDPTYGLTRESGRRIGLTSGSDTLVTADLPDADARAFEWATFAHAMVMRAREGTTLLGTAGEEDLYDAFINAAVGRLDRYSRYATASEAADLRAERIGYGGIGIEIEPADTGARITQVDPERPAAGSGLTVGDVITRVEGESLAGLSARRIEAMLRGPVDTSINLTIAREGLPAPLTVTVGRIQIVPNTVFYEPVDGRAVIRISSFNRRTAKRFAEAISQAHADAEDGQLRGLILDLRGNLGGVLDQAVDTADLMLEEGLISRTDGRHPESHQRFYAEPGDLASGVPIVVLINGASASAAEILAAALQDHGRAAVVGMSSFGKGSIQTVIEMPNGGELFVTWARFVAPSGYALQRFGVMPSICTSGAGDAVEILDAALSVDSPISGRVLLAQRRQLDPSDSAAAQAAAGLCPWRPHASGDIDRTIAELLLESPALMRQALALGGTMDGS